MAHEASSTLPSAFNTITASEAGRRFLAAYGGGSGVGNSSGSKPFILCGGGHLSDLQLVEWYITPVKSYWTFSFGMIPDTMCFRAHGWAFFLVGLMSLVAFLGCLCAVVVLRKDAWHRVALYLFFALSMLMRGVFCMVSFVKLLDVKVQGDLMEQAPWFRDYLMPVNACADLVAAWVDVLLTWFWVKALSGMPGADWRPMAVLIVLSSAVLGVCIGVDANNVDRLAREGAYSVDAGVELWQATLIFVGIVMTVTAVLHFASVAYLMQQIVSAGLHHHPGFRHQLVKVASIALVTILCSVARGLCVLLRYEFAAFKSGPLSFNEPLWTAFYYAGLVALPVYVVAIAYGGLVLNRLQHDLHGDRAAVLAAAAYQHDYYDSTADDRYHLEPSTDHFVLPDD